MNAAQAHMTAADIERQLHESGVTAEVRYLRDQHIMAARFVLIAASPAYTKTLASDPSEANAESFREMFGKWKRNMALSLKAKTPGPALRGALAVHGEAVVNRVLYG